MIILLHMKVNFKNFMIVALYSQVPNKWGVLINSRSENLNSSKWGVKINGGSESENGLMMTIEEGKQQKQVVKKHKLNYVAKLPST